MSPICSGDLTTVHEHRELCGCLQAVSADKVAQTSHTLHVQLSSWTARSLGAVGHHKAGTGCRAGAQEVGVHAEAAGVMGPCALEVSPESEREEVSCYLLVSLDP